MMKCVGVLKTLLCLYVCQRAIGSSGADSEKTTNNDKGIETLYKRSELGELTLTLGPTNGPMTDHDARYILNIASSLVEKRLSAAETTPIRQLQYFRMFGVQDLSWQPQNRRSLLQPARELNANTGGYTAITYRGAVAQYTVVGSNIAVPTPLQLLDEINAALFPDDGKGLVYELRQDPQSRFPSIASADITYITDQPTSNPSSMPSSTPSVAPTLSPSTAPSLVPSSMPSDSPSSLPSNSPSALPSEQPSTARPSSFPSEHPSSFPSTQPSTKPPVVPRSQINNDNDNLDILQNANAAVGATSPTSIGGGANSSPIMAAAAAVVATLLLAVGLIWKRRRDKQQTSSSLSSPTDTNTNHSSVVSLPSRKNKKRLHLHTRDHLNKDEEATDDDVDDASETFSVVLAKAAIAAGTPKTVALTDDIDDVDDDTDNDMLNSPYSPNARTTTGLSIHSAQSIESFENTRAMTFILSKDMLYANNAASTVSTASPIHQTNNYDNSSKPVKSTHNNNNKLSPSHFIAANDNASLDASDKASDFVNLEFEPDADWDPDDNDNDTIASSSQIFKQHNNLEIVEQMGTFGERIGSFLEKFRNSASCTPQQQNKEQQQSSNAIHNNPNTMTNTSENDVQKLSKQQQQFNNKSSSSLTDSEGGHFV